MVVSVCLDDEYGGSTEREDGKGRGKEGEECSTQLWKLSLNMKEEETDWKQPDDRRRERERNED